MIRSIAFHNEIQQTFLTYFHLQIATLNSDFPLYNDCTSSGLYSSVTVITYEIFVKFSCIISLIGLIDSTVNESVSPDNDALISIE